MESFKGWIVNSVLEYESKQQELIEKYNIVGRYSGRMVDGATIPDVVLKSGKYFIPDKNGVDVIQRLDILNKEI